MIKKLTYKMKPPGSARLQKGRSVGNGIAGGWFMRENSGDELNDFSGHNTIGTIIGATWTDTKFGRGLDFDAFNDRVDCGNPAILQTQAMSLVVWARPESNSKSIVTKGDQSRGNANQRDWDLFGSGADLRFLVSTGAGWILNLGVGSGFPTLNQHHQFVVTWDGTTTVGGGNIYVDGSLWATGTATGTSNANNFNLFIGGRRTAGTHYEFDGQIDHVIIYDHALIYSEVKLIYNRPFYIFDRPARPLYHIAAGGPPPAQQSFMDLSTMYWTVEKASGLLTRL